MIAYCTRDKDWTRVIWRGKPQLHASGYWATARRNGTFSSALCSLLDGSSALDILFPRGVKPGQCVKCELQRLKISE